MTRLTPLTNLDSSLAKYNAASATSSAVGATPFKFADEQIIPSTTLLSTPIAFTNIGVATAHGETQFTLIPCCPNSAHKFFMSPTTACFEAVYECGDSPEETEAKLDVKRMIPFFSGIMTRAAYFAPRNDPYTLTSNTFLKFSLSASIMLKSRFPGIPIFKNDKIKLAHKNISRSKFKLVMVNLSSEYFLFRPLFWVVFI